MSGIDYDLFYRKVFEVRHLLEVELEGGYISANQIEEQDQTSMACYHEDADSQTL